MRSLDDLFLVWLLASMIAALLPVPRAPMMWGFGMLVWPCPRSPGAWWPARRRGRQCHARYPLSDSHGGEK